MIGVISFLCFLMFACRCQSILDEEGYSDHHSYEAQIESRTMRVNNGTPITLKCQHDLTKWEYKPCDSNFNKLLCDDRHHWHILNETKGRIHIGAVTTQHIGIYRCSQDNRPLKIFFVEVVLRDYDGSAPTVAPLKISNITGQINKEFTLQCNVTSMVPASIFWFKSCYGHKCDFKFNDICYCLIKTSITSYSIGNTYLSKFMIFNARDVDSGMYVCLAVSQYGMNFQNVTILVPSCRTEENESFSLLFIIPLLLILVPVLLWLCYCKRRKKKSATIMVEHEKHLFRPVVQTNEI